MYLIHITTGDVPNRTPLLVKLTTDARRRTSTEAGREPKAPVTPPRPASSCL